MPHAWQDKPWQDKSTKQYEVCLCTDRRIAAQGGPQLLRPTACVRGTHRVAPMRCSGAFPRPRHGKGPHGVGPGTGTDWHNKNCFDAPYQTIWNFITLCTHLQPKTGRRCRPRASDPRRISLTHAALRPRPWPPRSDSDPRPLAQFRATRFGCLLLDRIRAQALRTRCTDLPSEAMHRRCALHPELSLMIRCSCRTRGC